MSSIIPSARQLEYQDWEYGLFLHFGLRTFYEGWRDMDPRPMSPAEFRPTALNCHNWAATAKAAGMNYIVLTAKHHCGFANWPSQYTDFSVASSPWKDGRGDVVGEFIEACRTHGLAAGLYYSPYDHNNPSYSDPKAYDDYFINQISELLVPYGPLDILWFDGCGSEGHQYDWPRIIGEIRRMQPGIRIFSMGDPDFRWVGNEDGVAPLPLWNVVDSVPFSIRTDQDESVGERKWLPAECDCRMRERNWFFSDQDEHTVKSVEELLGLYYLSVGRGANLLLNIGPDRHGLLPEKDARRLLELGAELSRRFDHPLTHLSDAQRTDAGWVVPLGESRLVDHVVLQEDIAQGERIRRFQVQIVPTHYHTPITVWEGYNVGHKAICRFATVRARQVLVNIAESDGEPLLRELTVHHAGTA